MRRPLLVAALAAASAVPSAADAPLEPPDLANYLRWGPVRVRPGFGIKNLGKDDNVFFTTGDEQPQSDYRVTLSPALDGLVLFGDRAFLEFNERLDYTIYREFSDQNYVNNFFTSRVTVPFQRFGVFTDIDFIQRENRPTSEFDSRVKQDQRRGAVGVIVELGWRTYAEIQRVRSDWSFDDPADPTTSDLLDRVEKSNELTLNYRLTGQTRLTLDTVSKKYEFDDPTVGRDSRENRLVPGIVFGEGARIFGLLKVGTSEFNLKDPGKLDYDGLVAEADLAYRLGASTLLRVNGHREVGFAVYQGNNFFLDKQIGLRAIHYLNRLIGFDASRTWGDLTFPESGDAVEREDTLRQYELGLRIRIAQGNLKNVPYYRLSWRRWRRDANEPFNALDQTRTVWGFSAVVGF